MPTLEEKKNKPASPLKIISNYQSEIFSGLPHSRARRKTKTGILRKVFKSIQTGQQDRQKIYS